MCREGIEPSRPEGPGALRAGCLPVPAPARVRRRMIAETSMCKEGLEPSRPSGPGALEASCLPIPALARWRRSRESGGRRDVQGGTRTLTPVRAWRSDRQLSTNSSTCTHGTVMPGNESAGQGSNLPAPESAVGLQPTASPLRRPAEVMSRSSGKMSSRFGDPRRSGRRDSNPRPRAPQTRALTRLSYVPCSRSTNRGNERCRGGGIRTRDLLLPKQAL